MGKYSEIILAVIFFGGIMLIDYFRLKVPKKKEERYISQWSGRGADWAANDLNNLLPKEYKLTSSDRESFEPLYDECMEKARERYFNDKYAMLDRRYYKSSDSWLMALLYDFFEKKEQSRKYNASAIMLKKVMLASMLYLESTKLSRYSGPYMSNILKREIDASKN